MNYNDELECTKKNIIIHVLLKVTVSPCKYTTKSIGNHFDLQDNSMSLTKKNTKLEQFSRNRKEITFPL